MEQNKSYYLRVEKVDAPVEASNGNGSYKKVVLRQFVSAQKSGSKWINSPTAKSVTFNMWTAQKRTDGSMTKPHFLYDVIAPDMELEGVIVTLNTTPYVIESNGVKRTANSITVAVFEGEDAIQVGNSQLSNRDACVTTIDEEGVATNTLNLTELRERNAAKSAGNNTGKEALKNEGVDDLNKEKIEIPA